MLCFLARLLFGFVSWIAYYLAFCLQIVSCVDLGWCLPCICCSRSTWSGSWTATTSKMEHLVIIVNAWKPLTIITKSSILDVAAVLDPPLIIHFWVSIDMQWFSLTLFSPIFAFYNPLKTPKTQRVSGVFREYKIRTLTRNELTIFSGIINDTFYSFKRLFLKDVWSRMLCFKDTAF